MSWWLLVAYCAGWLSAILVGLMANAGRISRIEEAMQRERQWRAYEKMMRASARELLEKLPPPETDEEAIERLIATTQPRRAA